MKSFLKLAFALLVLTAPAWSQGTWPMFVGRLRVTKAFHETT